MRHSPRYSQGFSLLELLVVVAILSLLATVVVPSLLGALDRGRQSSTTADMRSIATALERYAVSYETYPEVGNMNSLREFLVPRYIKKLPGEDGWGHPFSYEVGSAGFSYTLSSPGKDGIFQDGPFDEETHDFVADIVCVDGVFVQRPAGEQD